MNRLKPRLDLAKRRVMIEFDDPDDPQGKAWMAARIISRGMQNILAEETKEKPKQAPEQPKEEDFIQETIDFWEKRTDKKFTREDARQMIENVAGYFNLLMELDNKQKSSNSGDD